MDVKKNIPLLIIFVYGIIGYSPYFGSIDQIAPQWLELTFFNLVCSIYLLFQKKIEGEFKITKSPILISLIIFTIWGLLSFSYATNYNEVIIISTRWINVVTSIYIIANLIKRSKIKLYDLSAIISLLLLIEISASLYSYIQIVLVRPFEFKFTDSLIGLTGNKNITSSSIAVKIPFLIYLTWSMKKSFKKFLLFIILGCAYFNLIVLSSRAIYISVISINVALILFYLLNRNNKNFFEIKRNTLATVGVYIAVLLYSFISLGKENTANIVNRIQTINYTDDSTQQRLRFYSHAFNHFLDNPFIGVGLGNWKIKSVDYDSQKMKSYIVPYHVHNDFLEISAELGLIGLILYVTPFIIFLVGFFKNLNSNYYKQYFILFLAILVYSIDAMLNFPQARVINQLNFIFIFSYLINIQTSKGHET